eukprot:4992595-Alexandrium_andersonii.AAC.1
MGHLGRASLAAKQRKYAEFDWPRRHLRTSKSLPRYRGTGTGYTEAERAREAEGAENKSELD